MAFQVVDPAKWSSHGGEAEGTAVKMARSDGVTEGFDHRARQGDPRSSIWLPGGGYEVHTEKAKGKT